ncbi:hypothetical protein Hanom_Chr15g01339901 [Helianthus anomalus]
MSPFSNFSSNKQQFRINEHPFIDRTVRTCDRPIRTNGFRATRSRFNRPRLMIAIVATIIIITITTIIIIIIIKIPFFYCPNDVLLLTVTVTHTSISD